MASSTEPEMHPVYRAIMRPRKLASIDRNLFFLCLLVGACGFNLFYSIVAGLLMGTGLYVLIRTLTAEDPQMLRILLLSTSYRARYDPGKRDPFEIEVQ